MHATKERKRNLETIRARAEFLKIQSKGKKWVARGLILQVMENDTGKTRIGFTVSKKVDKSAVVRNRIKRRLRSVAADILTHQAHLSADYILVGRTETATKPYESLCKDLKWCLKKTGFYAEKQDNA